MKLIELNIMNRMEHTVRGIWLHSSPLLPSGHSHEKSLPWSIHWWPSGHGLFAQKSTCLHFVAFHGIFGDEKREITRKTKCQLN